jgi:hypothetical protein
MITGSVADCIVVAMVSDESIVTAVPVYKGQNCFDLRSSVPLDYVALENHLHSIIFLLLQKPISILLPISCLPNFPSGRHACHRAEGD